MARIPFKAADYITVYTRDGGRGGICGAPVPPEAVSIDHVQPLARGGRHELGNWQLAHRRCNSQKRDRVRDEEPYHAAAHALAVEELRARPR